MINQSELWALSSLARPFWIHEILAILDLRLEHIRFGSKGGISKRISFTSRIGDDYRGCRLIAQFDNGSTVEEWGLQVYSEACCSKASET
jgi:hypothetical protein